MNPVIRSALIYVLLLAIFRLTGKRTMAQITPFDFILLVVISQVTQQEMLDNDYSFTDSLVVTLTLIVLEIVFAFLQRKSRFFSQLVEGNPIMIVENGKMKKRIMEKEQVSVNDILQSARKQGIGMLNQIRYAILERDGTISIIPKDKSQSTSRQQESQAVKMGV